MSQNDFGIWTKLDLRIPIDKKLQGGVELNLRTNNYSTSVNNSFISPYLNYDIGKYMNIGADYRFINEASQGHFFGDEFSHRITVDLTFKNLIDLLIDKSRFEASVRFRGTHKTGEGDRNDNYLRSLLKISYNVKGIKLEPEISGELFYHFNDQLNYTFTSVNSHHRLSDYRLRCKLNYELSKRHSVFVGYFIEGTFESMKINHVLNIGYRYSLKRLDKIFKK